MTPINLLRRVYVDRRRLKWFVNFAYHSLEKSNDDAYVVSRWRVSGTRGALDELARLSVE